MLLRCIMELSIFQLRRKSLPLRLALYSLSLSTRTLHFHFDQLSINWATFEPLALILILLTFGSRALVASLEYSTYTTLQYDCPSSSVQSIKSCNRIVPFIILSVQFIIRLPHSFIHQPIRYNPIQFKGAQPLLLEKHYLSSARGLRGADATPPTTSPVATHRQQYSSSIGYRSHALPSRAAASASIVPSFIVT